MTTFVRWHGGPWHHAEKREVRGDKGTVLGSYYALACSTKAYSPWGPEVKEHVRTSDRFCKKCAKATR